MEICHRPLAVSLSLSESPSLNSSFSSEKWVKRTTLRLTYRWGLEDAPRGEGLCFHEPGPPDNPGVQKCLRASGMTFTLRLAGPKSDHRCSGNAFKSSPLWWFRTVSSWPGWSHVSPKFPSFCGSRQSWSEEKFAQQLEGGGEAATPPLWSSWLESMNNRRCQKVPACPYSLPCMPFGFLTAGPAEP